MNFYHLNFSHWSIAYNSSYSGCSWRGCLTPHDLFLQEIWFGTSRALVFIQGHNNYTCLSITLLSDNWHNSSPLPPAKLQTRRLCFAAIIRSKSPEGTEFRCWFLNCVREMHSSSLPSQSPVFFVGINMFVTFDLRILIKMEWENDIRILLNQNCIFVLFDSTRALTLYGIDKF